MSLKVYYADQGVLSDSEFQRLAGKASSVLNRVIGKLGRFRLERAASGGQVKYYGTAAEGPAIPATYFPTGDWLHLYLPVFRANPGILESVLIHELGHRYWFNYVPGFKRSLWNKKYTPANRSTIDRIQHLLKTKKYNRYMDLVDDFDNPNERLVAIHVANALIVNKYPAKLTGELDIREHPATKDFCKGSRPYSLIPLISAYAREADYEDYAETFRAFVESNGKLTQLRDASVREALLDLFNRVCF
jgi:hypothetical protein